MAYIYVYLSLVSMQNVQTIDVVYYGLVSQTLPRCELVLFHRLYIKFGSTVPVLNHVELSTRPR